MLLFHIKWPWNNTDGNITGAQLPGTRSVCETKLNISDKVSRCLIVLSMLLYIRITMTYKLNLTI
jgi:hypothetical protein